MSYTKVPTVINDLSDVDTVTTSPINGSIFSFDGTDWIPRELLPVAQITRTSKISNKLTVDATASSAILNGDLLTYLWTISPAAGVTIATPNAISTTIVCPSGKAEYTLTLTVTSFLTGLSATDTYEFKTDTKIEVMGTDEEHNDFFGTLASAYAWITANDNANYANYQIDVLELTTDAARINPGGGARVHFTQEGRVNVGFDLTVATTYIFTGDGESFHIVAAAGTAFTVGAGCTLFLEGMIVGAATSNGIVMNGPTLSVKKGSVFALASPNTAIQGNASTVTIQHSNLITIGTGDNISMTGGTLEVQHSYLQGNGSGANIRTSANTNLAIYYNRFLNNGAVGVTPFNLFLNTGVGIIHGNTFQIIPLVAIQCRNIYANATITGPLTLSNNNFIQAGGNNGTNSCCLMMDANALQPVHVTGSSFLMLSNNPAVITVQTANNINWKFTNNSVVNAGGGAAITSSTTNGAIVPVALVGLNYFNNAFNGAVNGPLAFNPGVALGSENIQY